MSDDEYDAWADDQSDRGSDHLDREAYKAERREIIRAQARTSAGELGWALAMVGLIFVVGLLGLWLIR